MKIAYLLMVNKNPKHLNRLLRALDHKDVDFYIHIDKKSTTRFSLPDKNNIHVLSHNIPVYWGGFSQVLATMLLMQAAKQAKKYDYYVLLSGSDFPVRSNAYIHEYLQANAGKEFINICAMPLYGKTFDRIDYFYLEGSIHKVVSLVFTIFNKISRFKKRHYPKKYSTLTLYGGSTWWALTDDCVEYILTFIENNPEFLHFYKYTLCSDEMFFHTIIGNSQFKKNITNAFMYTDWNSNELPLPAKIREQHLPILKKKIGETVYGNGRFPILFARKFFDESEAVVSLIEKKLRK